MIVLIFILNLFISLAVLFFIKKRKVIKYSSFLKYVNITQIISILLVPILFVFLMIDLNTAQPIINDGRAFGIYLFFIYALFGIIVLILNTIILLINYFSHKK
jgi:hypothetical protein